TDGPAKAYGTHSVRKGLLHLHVEIVPEAPQLSVRVFAVGGASAVLKTAIFVTMPLVTNFWDE
ncbi:hypothetical protein L917_08379, partial [Phytophthora nicotianae]